MNTCLPLTREWVIENLCDKEMVLYQVRMDGYYFHNGLPIRFNDDGTAVSEGHEGSWIIEDGRLLVWCGVTMEFNGFSYQNGVVLLGSPGFVIVPKKNYDLDLGVIVSTNQKYRDKTLPVIIPSLLKAGFAKEDIRIVSSGCKLRDCDCEDSFDNIPIKRISYKAMGCGGFAAEGVGKHVNWLTLYDTCVVEPDLIARIEKLDFSLNPDFIAFDREIGIASTWLVRRMRDNINYYKGAGLLHCIAGLSRVLVEADGFSREGRLEDCYKTGNKRKRLSNPNGIVKYASLARRRGIV